MSSNSKHNLIFFLKLSALLAVVAGLYAALTYGQAVIHSDTATTNRVFKTMVANKSFYPSTWNFYNSELYSFSIIGIGAVVQLFIHNTIISRIIASALVLVFACFSLVWLGRNVFKDKSYLIALPILFVFMCDTNYRDMFFYQAAYVTPVVALSLCYGMAYKLLIEKERRLSLILAHTILLFLFMLAGLRYAAEYVLPFSCMVGLNFIILLKNKSQEAIKYVLKNYLLLFLAPALAGFLLYEYVTTTHASHVLSSQVGSISINLSLTNVLSNIKVSFVNLFHLFGHVDGALSIKGMLALVISIGVFVVFPLLQLIDFRKLNKAERDYTIFGLIHNILLLAVVLLGSKTYERYILTVVFVSVIISANYIYRTFLSKTDIKAAIVSVIFIALTVFYSISFFASTTGYRQMAQEQKDTCNILLDKGITKVYGSYWITYPFEIYSNNAITSGAVTIKPRILQKNYILVDDSAFETNAERSCIIMTREEAENCSNAVHIMLGQQDEDFLIEEAIVSNNENYYITDLVVYVYDRDVGDELSPGFRAGVLGIKDLDFNWYGTITESSILLEENGLVHGPYSFLPKGHYLIRIEGKNLVGCNCAVVSDIANSSVNSTVTEIEDDHINIDLILTGGVEDLQIYLSNPMPDTIVEFYDILVDSL